MPLLELVYWGISEARAPQGFISGLHVWWRAHLDRVGSAAYVQNVALLLLVSGGVALMVIVWTVVWRLQRSSRISPQGRGHSSGSYESFG
jgi:hypothetical protein